MKGGRKEGVSEAERDIVGLPRLLQTNGLHFICAAWINKADAAESVAAVASSTDLSDLKI